MSEEMTAARAAEILDPDRKERFNSIQIVEQACRMGRDALLKQVPMKPDIENSDMDGWAVCPSCEEYIVRPDSSDVAYCRYCGQAIEWEDDDEG